MLVEHTLFGVNNKVNMAIERLKSFQPPDGYYLAFSGGKDSQTIYHLAKMAGVKFDAHYNHTTVDPPELIYFIREHYPDVIAEFPPMTMWELIVKKRFPMTRKVRYCCEVLKEGGGRGRTVITGVRWAESSRRKANRAMLELNAYSSKNKTKIMLNNDNEETRRLFETCVMKGKHILNPIIDWTEDDVWEFLHAIDVPYCCLYDEGYSRLGCIACPMGGEKGMLRDFARYPKYERAYLRAFDKMLKKRIVDGLLPLKIGATAEEIMEWWIFGSDRDYGDPDQILIDGYMED